MQIELKLKKCPKHSSNQVDSVCMSGQCTGEILLCQMCSKDKHPHYNISITDFKSLFNKKIAQKRGKLQNVNYDETPIELIAKNYKSEIDQDQLKVIEGIMKELKQEKRIIVDQLTRTTIGFSDKYSKQLKKVQNLKPLRDFDPVSLLLKMKMSSSDKIGAIRDAYLALNRLSDEQLLILRQQKALKNKMVKFVKEKNLGNFVEKLKQTVIAKKTQVRAAGVKQKGRTGSVDKTAKRSGIFDRRRSSDELAPSLKPAIRC